MIVGINSQVWSWICWIFLAVFLAGCGEEGAVVTTHQQAFDLMKQEVLAKHLDKLEEVGADASIFENVDMDVVGDQPCNKPLKYFNVFGLTSNAKKFDGMLSKLFEIKKGLCLNCYDLVSVFISISRYRKIYETVIQRKRIENKEYENCSDGWKEKIMKNLR